MGEIVPNNADDVSNEEMANNRTGLKAVGVALLCWFCSSGVCQMITLFLMLATRPGARSTGGLLALVVGIVCAVKYKNDASISVGKLAGISALCGIGLAVLAILGGLLLAASK